MCTNHQRHPFARIGCRYPYINKLLTKCQQLSTDYSFFLRPQHLFLSHTLGACDASHLKNDHESDHKLIINTVVLPLGTRAENSALVLFSLLAPCLEVQTSVANRDGGFVMFSGFRQGCRISRPLVFVIHMHGDGSPHHLRTDLTHQLPQGASQQTLWQSVYRIVD